MLCCVFTSTVFSFFPLPLHNDCNTAVMAKTQLYELTIIAAYGDRPVHWFLSTGCPRMFYTQKCKILRILITIKTIEFGILIYLSDRAVLLAFWRILNQGNRPNETENT